MKLKKLIYLFPASSFSGDEDCEITGIQADSRLIKAGNLFVAIRGTAVDGHLYIESAIGKGATAVVCEKIPDGMEEKCSFILVKDSAEALGKLASAWYSYPSEKLRLVGVTGTNGKTQRLHFFTNFFEN